jgi:hypothetical protein
MNEKFTLTLNSHALSDFQNCEMQYALGDLISLQKTGPTKPAFLKGTEIAKILEIYYHRRMKRKSLKALGRIDLLYKRFTEKGIEPKDASLMIGALVEYFRQYASESWEIVAVEKGYSKILYEDEDNLFIYEGRPDLVVKVDGELVVVDHKTQGQHDNIFAFNNQARGYCWALGTQKFVYNYLVFKKAEQCRRNPHNFSPQQIEQWQEDTIQWFFRIKKATQDKKFLRSWQCTGKYGLCPFTDICTASNEAMRSWIISRDFEITPRRMSW